MTYHVQAPISPTDWRFVLLFMVVILLVCS